MKRLTIVRHAKSSWNHPDLSDFDRPLNKRGERNAPEMGRRLADRGESVDHMITSPAVRALTTAGMIADALGHPRSKIALDDGLYGASASETLRIVKNCDDQVERLMIFGHNPGLTDFAELMTGVRIENVPTSGVVIVDLAVDRWADVELGSGELVDFDYPKRTAG